MGSGRDRHGQRITLAGTVASLLVAVAAGPAVAGDAVRHGTSKRPYWEVGVVDGALSDACRRNRFNQISDTRLFISYRGARGAGVTGIARKGWNLRDLDSRAVPEATYHFADDGLSTCRVYVSMPKVPAGR